jgi:putative copper resistance protein D
MSPDAALTVCRFFHDASTMLLFGASACIAALVPPSLARDIVHRLRFLGIVAAAIAVATTVALLPLETAFVGDGWRDALNASAIGDVLSATSVGWAWQAQALAALALVGSVALWRRGRWIATAASSGFLLASVSLTGHAVMQENWLGVAHRISDAVHLLCAGAWLGALVPLLVVFRAVNDPERRREAEAALSRFSMAGPVIVALIVASGIVNTVLVLGRWPTDWSSPYQTMLALKVALVAVMVTLAVVNRYAFVPRIARQPSRSLHALRLATIAEVTLGICVVVLVSVFGMFDPT